MSILPRLEQSLLDAAHRRLAAQRRQPTRAHAARAARARRLRAPLIAFGALLASATIALAAGGVILTGAPVRPSDQRNPGVGVGVPVAGGSTLLPVRAPDPEGGLPWGMRIVHTTRGEVCLQIGRVDGDQLGVLGIDGAFHDDGRFHPLPPSALPSITPIGLQPPGDANTSCNLEGHAVAGGTIGIDRSAGPGAHRQHIPLSDLRDVYYGLLGPQAVDVTYSVEHARRTEPVVRDSGAYLVVRRTTPDEQTGSGGWSIGTYGDLAPYGAITTIGYRIDGAFCERGPEQPPWSTTRLPDACPEPHWPHSLARTPSLHRPVRVQLLIHDGEITGADVSFTAPFAIDSASHEYVVAVPSCNARGVIGGGAEQTLERDVARGATLRFHLSDPFSGRLCASRSLTIAALYRGADGGGSVIVGSATVHEPPGTRPAPLPPRVRIGHRSRHPAKRYAIPPHSIAGSYRPSGQ